MKKKILLIATAIILVSIISIGTLAYFTDEEKARNVITTGNIDIELEEWMEDADNNDELIPFPENGVSDVMPGSQISKIVQVRNVGGNPAYVRIQVEKAIELDDVSAGQVPDLDLITFNLNTEKWELGTDGYYYYKNVLQPGEVTEPLFTVVTFDSDMDNMYQKSSATVDVTAYAVQSDNNGATVFEAKGWPK